MLVFIWIRFKQTEINDDHVYHLAVQSNDTQNKYVVKADAGVKDDASVHNKMTIQFNLTTDPFPCCRYKQWAVELGGT